MPTKTFSSRADEKKIALADALAQQRFGMSFGKYCGTVLLDSVCETGQFPQLEQAVNEKKRKAFEAMKAFCAAPHDASIARLSDGEIRELIAGRYA